MFWWYFHKFPDAGFYAFSVDMFRFFLSELTTCQASWSLARSLTSLPVEIPRAFPASAMLKLLLCRESKRTASRHGYCEFRKLMSMVSKTMGSSDRILMAIWQRSFFKAVDLLAFWERLLTAVTSMQEGRCDKRTEEYFRLRFCPPGPEDWNSVNLHSFSNLSSSQLSHLFRSGWLIF